MNIGYGATDLSSNKKTLKVGLIGCGGRGTGAAVNAVNADPNVVLTAMGDIFEDHLEKAYAVLKEEEPDKIKVDDSHKFIGFDAYQKVIDSGVDVVLLATPPNFRPDHMEAAIKAGKHVFSEKPVAVDPPGVRKVLAAAREARRKNLSILSGFCYRYDNINRAAYKRIHEGAIGEIRSVSTMRLDRKSTRLNSSHVAKSYAVLYLKKKSQLSYINKN